MPEQQDNPLSVVTTTALLEGLRDPRNQPVWDQFVHRYQPLLLQYARKLGLGAEDAQDVAQQSLVSFYSGYQEGQYQREKGRLRQWLFGIARHHVIRVFERRRHRDVDPEGRGGSSDLMAGVAADDQMEKIWEQEWTAAVLRQCLQIARTEFGYQMTQAFELYAWQGWAAKRVAEHLGMTENAVFIAKHRILKRIRELLPEMEQ